jgi:alkylation response protein AidB-like acyl-CoA dehydrogenase
VSSYLSASGPDESTISSPINDIDFLERARAISPLIRSQGDAIEAGGRITEPVVAAMKEAGLFWMVVPRKYGGGQADLTSVVTVLEEVSCADASSGWILIATGASNAFAAMFCGDKAVEEMFCASEPAIVAGMPAPGGKAVRVGNGYRGGGRFSYGSGFSLANWISGGLTVYENGVPRMRRNGTPETHCCFLPRDRVKCLENWNVIGLVGTASYDYEIPEQDIDFQFMPDLHADDPRPGPVYALGHQAISCAFHAGWALGVMRRALEEIVPLVAGKKRRGYARFIGEDSHFLHEFVAHEAKYRAARAFALSVYGEAVHSPVGGHPKSALQQGRIRQCNTWLHNTASEVVRFCHVWAGGAAIRQNNILGRCTRDMAVATNHLQFDPVSFVEAGPAIMQDWDGQAHVVEGHAKKIKEPEAAP